jgi:hypothetical protein
MQRRTLGVYPDMGPDAARASLAAARSTRRSLEEAMERSAHAAATRPEPRPVARTSPAVRFGALALFGVLAAYLGIALYERSGTPAHDEPTTRTLPAQSTPESAAPAPTTAIEAVPSAVLEAATPATTSPSVPTAAPLAELSSDASPPASPVAAATTPAAASRPATPVSVAHKADAATRVARDTHVARAQLTSDVVKREPVDAIGPEIHGERGSVGRVFFYTEVRGLSGSQLRYRWEREGHLEMEMPMQVGTSWRWRTYSRKDLLPDQTGAWRVQLVDETDRVLAEASFVYRTDPTDAQSADAN